MELFKDLQENFKNLSNFLGGCYWKLQQHLLLYVQFLLWRVFTSLLERRHSDGNLGGGRWLDGLNQHHPDDSKWKKIDTFFNTTNLLERYALVIFRIPACILGGPRGWEVCNRTGVPGTFGPPCCSSEVETNPWWSQRLRCRSFKSHRWGDVGCIFLVERCQREKVLLYIQALFFNIFVGQQLLGGKNPRPRWPLAAEPANLGGSRSKDPAHARDCRHRQGKMGNDEFRALVTEKSIGCGCFSYGESLSKWWYFSEIVFFYILQSDWVERLEI